MKGSPLRIDKEGRWFYQGEEITHRRTYLLYSRSLTRDEASRIIVKIGREECPVEVEDAPFVVRSLQFVTSKQGALDSLWLILNDESRELLAPETLRIGTANVPYCQVRGGMFEARFSRGAYQLLVPFIQQDGKREHFFIIIAGKKYNLS
jgi:hypothetical protein